MVGACRSVGSSRSLGRPRSACRLAGSDGGREVFYRPPRCQRRQWGTSSHGSTTCTYSIQQARRLAFCRTPRRDAVFRAVVSPRRSAIEFQRGVPSETAGDLPCSAGGRYGRTRRSHGIRTFSILDCRGAPRAAASAFSAGLPSALGRRIAARDAEGSAACVLLPGGSAAGTVCRNG